MDRQSVLKKTTVTELPVSHCWDVKIIPGEIPVNEN